MFKRILIGAIILASLSTAFGMTTLEKYEVAAERDYPLLVI